MAIDVRFSTPPGTMRPIGPYTHIARIGPHIFIGGVAGVNPETGELAGPDVASQTCQILDAFEAMLASVGANLAHVVQISVYLKDLADVAAVHAAWESRLGAARPAQTTVAVADLPKAGARLTMSLIAVARS